MGSFSYAEAGDGLLRTNRGSAGTYAARFGPYCLFVPSIVPAYPWPADAPPASQPFAHHVSIGGTPRAHRSLSVFSCSKADFVLRKPLWTLGRLKPRRFEYTRHKQRTFTGLEEGQIGIIVECRLPRAQFQRLMELNKMLVQAGANGDLARMSSLCVEEADSLNEVNVATAMKTLGFMVRFKRCTKEDIERSGILDTIFRKLHETAPRFKSRAISTFVYGCALTGVQRKDALDKLAGSSMQQLDQFSASTLSNLIWSFASLRYSNRTFYETAVSEVMRRLPEFNSQSLSLICWALAVTGLKDLHEFLDVIADYSVAHIGQFDEQGLSNTAWAYARLDFFHRPLFQAIADESCGRLHLFSAQGLANTIWAMGCFRFHHVEFYRRAARDAMRRIHQFRAQGLSNLALAFARVDVLDEELMDAISLESRRTLNTFSTQGLANMCWSLGKLGYRDDLLMKQLAIEIRRRVFDFNPQELSNTAWAFAVQGNRDLSLLAAIAREAALNIDRQNLQGLANLGWALGSLRYADYDFWHALSTEVKRRGEQLIGEGQGVSNLTLAFAYVRFRDEELYETLVRTVVANPQAFTSQGLLNMSWALAAMEKHALLPPLLDIMDAASSSWPEADFERDTIFQLAAVNISLKLEAPQFSDRFPRGLLERLNHLSDVDQTPTRSVLHALVAAELKHVKPGFVEELFVECFYLDIAYPEEKIAIEVNGPHHFLYRLRDFRVSETQFDGDTAMKFRLLKKLGWRVVSVNHTQWNTCTDSDQRRELLVTLLSAPEYPAAPPSPPRRHSGRASKLNNSNGKASKHRS